MDKKVTKDKTSPKVDNKTKRETDRIITIKESELKALIAASMMQGMIHAVAGIIPDTQRILANYA